MSCTVVLDGVAKRFGSTWAVDGVSFTAFGGVTALLGPNGAGKSTVLRCLATVLRPDRGAVHVDGLTPVAEAQRTEIRRRLGYLPQQPAFAPGARVFDVVDHLGILKEQRDPRRRHADVVRVLRAVGLEADAHRKVRELSGGMVQRLGIAQALLGSPGLVLLDEPAAHLDPDQRLALRDELSHLGTRATVVVSTHLVDEVAAVANALVVLAAGRVAYLGTPVALTAAARGLVWLAPEQPPPGAGVVRSWRTPSGAYRCLGPPAPGGQLVEPTLEDAYLLLTSGHPLGLW